MKGASLLALGIAAGTALGVVLDNTALGIAVGLGVGGGLFAAAPLVGRRGPPSDRPRQARL
jgi:hypothetical protein